MKYLSDYTQEAQSAAFKKHGAFFAFSNKQFDEQKVEGVKYVNLGIGMIAPKDTYKALLDELDEIYKLGSKRDLDENGRDKVIERELYNYECFYTWDWQPAFEAVEDYGITAEEVKAVFDKLKDTVEV